MFGKGLKLFKILGFEVRIDASWLLLAVLIILSLSVGYFPFHYEDLGTAAYVMMGAVGAIGLFISIVLHELSHSLVARRFGVPMKGITLFMFGGVAKMDEECRSPKAEFLMAIAGPVASILLAGLFYVLYTGLKIAGAPVTVFGVPGYLAFINVVLAVFNLLPGFPLDGGRVLRAALWGWKKNFRWATRIASEIGSGFGIVLIILGIFNLLGGALIGGLWWCLIGMFLRGISRTAYQQVVVREGLAGEPVSRFMKRDPVTVPSDITVKQLVENYMYEHHFKMFPVTHDGQLRGCVSTQEVKSVPKDHWTETSVAEIATECNEHNTVDPEADATDALTKMNKTAKSRLLVVRDGALVGIIALKDMLKFLSVKLDLEGEGGGDLPRFARHIQQ